MPKDTISHDLATAMCANFSRASAAADSPLFQRRTMKRRTVVSRLWSDAISQCVGMKGGMIAQPVPGTVWLCSLRDAVLLTCGKVVPRVVTSDGEKRPVGAFEMLHQDVSSGRVISSARYFAKHLFQLFPVTRSRAIIRDGISRPARLRF